MSIKVFSRKFSFEFLLWVVLMVIVTMTVKAFVAIYGEPAAEGFQSSGAQVLTIGEESFYDREHYSLQAISEVLAERTLPEVEEES